MANRLRATRLACLPAYRKFVKLERRGGDSLLYALRAYLVVQKYARDRFFGTYADCFKNVFQYRNGVLHSLAGPAVEWANGDAPEYWANGIRYASLLHILCAKAGSEKPHAPCPHFERLNELRRPVPLQARKDIEEKARSRIRLTENRIVEMYQAAARERNGLPGSQID